MATAGCSKASTSEHRLKEKDTARFDVEGARRIAGTSL